MPPTAPTIRDFDYPDFYRAMVEREHLQVSKDQNFTSLVLDKTYDAFAAIDLNDILPAGNYYMRIALVDLLGFEGKFSAPRQIAVGRK